MSIQKYRKLIDSLNRDELIELSRFDIVISGRASRLAYIRHSNKQDCTCKKVRSYVLFNVRYMSVKYELD